MAVEEEHPVLAAGPADGSAERVADVELPRHRVRIAVQLLGPPVVHERRRPLVAEHGPFELVGAAARHRRDLQPARSSELGLVRRREHLHLGHRVDRQVQAAEQAIVPGVHRRHAVDHVGVLAAAADTAGAIDARREGHELLEIVRRDRQALELPRIDHAGSFAAAGLEHRRWRDVDRLGQADLRHEIDDDAVAAADLHVGPQRAPEARHRGLDDVDTRRQQGRHVQPLRVRREAREARALRRARDRHGGAGDGQPLGIGYAAGNRAGGDLSGAGRDGHEQQPGQAHEDQRRPRAETSERQRHVVREY